MTKAKLISITAQTLAAVDAFASEPTSIRTEIAAMLQGRRYDRGECIIKQNDPDRSVLFVISGIVRVTFYSSNGREVAFRDLTAGEMFGELAALDDGPRSAQVMAQGSAFIAWLPQGHFSQLLQHYPQFSDYVMRRLTGLVRLLSDRVVEMSTLGVTNRIHAELLRLARAAGPEGNRAIIAPSPTHADIANRISTHREAVAREIGVMTKKGLIQKVRGAMVIPDVRRLEEIVREVVG